MTTYVISEIKNSRVIESSLYSLSDGSYQLYVCLEMNKDNEV